MEGLTDAVHDLSGSAAGTLQDVAGCRRDAVFVGLLVCCSPTEHHHHKPVPTSLVEEVSCNVSNVVSHVLEEG